MMNRVCLIGRIACDVTLKYTPTGIAVSAFRLAVDRNIPNADGTRDADFIPVKVWREQAERINQYANKGSLVSVEGRLEVRTFTAADGTTRTAFDVVAESVTLL